jgi:hypothetical protein
MCPRTHDPAVGKGFHWERNPDPLNGLSYSPQKDPSISRGSEKGSRIFADRSENIPFCATPLLPRLMFDHPNSLHPLYRKRLLVSYNFLSPAVRLV